MTAIATSVVILVLAGGDLREHLPDQLKRIIESRQAKTSQFEWSVTWFGGEDEGMTERYITRSAGGALWQSNPGDENGFHYIHGAVDEHGNRVSKEQTKGTRNRLLFEGRVWSLQNAERPWVGRADSVDDPSYPPTRPLDFTAAGVAPYWLPPLNRTIFGVDFHKDYEHFESAAFSSSRRGGIETIVAEFDGRQLEWDLDHSKGGQPVRAAYYHGDRFLFESLTEVAQRGGRWFPSRIEFYKDAEPAPTHVIEVQRATFDEPWHMQEIHPEDIGVLWGTALFVPDAPPAKHRWDDGSMRWDGTRLISGEEYRILHYIYGIDPNPRITEHRAEVFGSLEKYRAHVELYRELMRDEYYKQHGQAPWLVQRWKERDEWDVYVEKFIKEHKLDEPRAKKANHVLDRAKQLRDYHKRRLTDRITKAQRENNAAKVEHFEKARKERTEEIFDMLVRGLKVLVPREPRVAGPDKDSERSE